MDVHPYLNFDGRCEEAFRFYETCLGGKIEGIFYFEGSPMAEHVPAGFGRKVMHATLSLKHETLLGADAPPGQYVKPQGFAVTLEMADPAVAERIYRELAEGGTVTMALQKTFWAERFGMLTDRWGIPWMINCGTPS